MKRSVLALTMLLLAVSVATAAGVQTDQRGMVVLSTLPNLGKLRAETALGSADPLTPPRSLTRSSALAFATLSRNKLLAASNTFYEAVRENAMDRQFEHLKAMSHEQLAGWIEVHENRLMAPYAACYQASRSFDELWRAVSVANTAKAYPSVEKVIDRFTHQISSCGKATASTK